MKKIFCFVLILSLLTSTCLVTFAVDTIQVSINGKPISFDQPPIMQNDRVLVPMRAVFEALGADVYWVEDEQTIVAVKNEIKILMEIQLPLLSKFVGDDLTEVESKHKEIQEISLDIAPQIINDKTYVPLRAVSEAMGVAVTWDEQNNSVLLTCNEEFLQQKNTDKQFFQKTFVGKEQDDSLVKKDIHLCENQAELTFDYANLKENTTILEAVFILKKRLTSIGYIDASVEYRNNKIDVWIPDIISSDDINSVASKLSIIGHLTFENSDGNVLLDNDDIVSVTAKKDDNTQDRYEVDIKLTDEGRKKFADATGEISKTAGKIFIKMDGKTISSPKVIEKIDSGEAVITGFTEEESNNYANLINSGMLPCELKLLETMIID